jgi:hypothetical protein
VVIVNATVFKFSKRELYHMIVLLKAFNVEVRWKKEVRRASPLTAMP